jgi:hypothetical protein
VFDVLTGSKGQGYVGQVLGHTCKNVMRRARASFFESGATLSSRSYMMVSASVSSDLLSMRGLEDGTVPRQLRR